MTNEDVIHHYLQKANPSELKLEQQYPLTLTNDELQAKLVQAENNVILIDVGEPAEFAFGHIPGALSIPLGMLEDNNELTSGLFQRHLCHMPVPVIEADAAAH